MALAAIENWRRRTRNKILDQEFGPKIGEQVGRGLDWVDDNVRAGARYAGRALYDAFTGGRQQSSFKRGVGNGRGRKRPRPDPKPKPSVKKPHYTHTIGQYRGRFNRRRYRPNRRLFRAKAVLKFETGGTLSGATQTQYIGHHNMPFERVWKVMWMAIIKKLAQMQKMDFTNWQTPVLDGLANTFNIVVTYRNGQVNQNWSTATFTPSAGTITWEGLADELGNFILNLITASSVRFEIREMYMKNNTGTTALISTQKIRGTDLRIMVKAISKMKLQNETVAQTGAADETSMLDIRNNPLEGKSYDVWGNYVEPKYFEHNGTAAPNVLAATPNDGIMFVSNNDPNHTTSMVNMYNKVLPGGFFNRCKKVARVNLAPGQIKTSTLVSTNTKTLNQWIGALLPTCRSSTAIGATLFSVPNNTGLSRIFGFEKMIDSRNLEPNISIAYDISTDFYASCYGQTKSFTAPLTAVA